MELYDDKILKCDTWIAMDVQADIGIQIEMLLWLIFEHSNSL